MFLSLITLFRSKQSGILFEHIRIVHHRRCKIWLINDRIFHLLKIIGNCLINTLMKN